MNKAEKYVRERLFAMRDSGYRDFHAKLVPSIDKEKIIGVRTPALRKFAGEFAKSPLAAEFLAALPHEYYEENNLHGFIIAGIRDFDECAGEISRFLPYVDNWATCDSLSPRVFAENRARLLPLIDEWLRSRDTYAVRFGIEMLMNHFLDEDFKPEYLAKVATVKSGEYYINMAAAWYFATALAKRYEETLPLFEEKRLDAWVHNKAIQKAAESFRVTNGHKAYLRTLKIK